MNQKVCLKCLRRSISWLFIFLLLFAIMATSSHAEETISVMSAGLTREDQRSIEDLFHTEYPDFQIRWVDDLDEESVKTRLLVRDSVIDVMSVSSLHGTLQELISKGYYVDLADIPIVRSNMESLFQPFQPLFFPSGDKSTIYAYPWNVSFQPLAYWENNVAMYMGIDDEPDVISFDYIMSLMDSMDSENDESVIVSDGSINPLILPAFECCKMQSISDNGTLHFFNPEFEAIFIRLLKHNKSTMSFDEPANPLITICPTDGEMILTQGKKWKCLSLYNDKTVPLGCFFQALIINPFSEHAAEAGFLLGCIAKHQSEPKKMALFDLGKDELPNPDYEEQISELQASIELCKEQLEKYPENADYWEIVIKDNEEMISTYSPFLISKENYSYYHNCIDNELYLCGSIPFEAANIDSYIYEQYLHLCREEISPASFLQNMDRVIYTMATENSGS